MFKLPSIELLIDKVIKTAKRFPLTILCAIIGTSILIHFTRVDWLDGNKHYFILDKILLCSELGLCLFFAAALFSESKKHSLVQKIIFQSCVLVFLVAYYFTLSGIETFDSVSITRYSLYIIAAHLLVSFAPFIGK
ncbi:MAG TPA: hypothetical protein VNG53_02840, partial [Bacteroidia bacterium]|nr:hypothetical protein [Bacteroidia bacterium]